MGKAALVCSGCGKGAMWQNRYFCPACGSHLEVRYAYDEMDARQIREELENARSFWDYRSLLPVPEPKAEITLGEGNTPLLKSARLGGQLDVDLYFKDETRNPTGAFKDRPNAVGISVAKSMGIRTVTIASTGNGAASLAAYAARDGMDCYVFVPYTTPAPKVAQASVYGAQIVRVKGDYSKAYQLALAAAQNFHWGNLTSTYLNPFTLEGDKTIAYEIFFQMNRQTPDWIVVPLGAGAMLTGIYKGFQELRLFGLTDKLPRMIGVQADGCAPIIRAFERDESSVQAWEQPQTVAGGICDPLDGYTEDGAWTLRSMRASGGCGVMVTDQEIMQALRQLAQKEAVFCEPASAASQAAVCKLVQKGIIKAKETVVDIITGHGLKDIECVMTTQKSVDAIEPDLKALCEKYKIT